MEILSRFRITKKSCKHLITDMFFSLQFVDNHISLLKPNYHFKKIKMNIVKKCKQCVYRHINCSLLMTIPSKDTFRCVCTCAHAHTHTHTHTLHLIYLEFGSLK